MTAATAALTMYDEALPDFSKTYTIANVLARRSACPGGIIMAGCYHVIAVFLLTCMASFASQGGARPSVAGPPEASISNGLVRAKLYLPDAENGYYRGTRFGWAGVIASLEYQGHNYFGQWFPRYDPKLHDSISGPVEEYTTGGSALNYTDAKPGETFVKIGVGVLKKPDEPRYAFRNPYEILDPGRWDIRSRPDAVEFSQELDDPKSGYAYVYRKTIIEMKIEPGTDFSRRITYDFYTLPERGEAGKSGTGHEWR